MEITERKKLEKLKKNNLGNKLLIKAIDDLLDELEEKNWKNQNELKKDRPDADNVHSDGFYFFNINIHRVMILIEFEEGEVTIVWCGTHDEYETNFGNNKNTITKWLRKNNWIS
jgi:mRNA interferase HigB